MQRLREHNVLLDDSAEHHSANLSSLIIKLNYEFDAQDKASALAVEALLLEIAVEVSREKEKISSDNKVPSWLSDARDFIHSEFTLNPTIKEIADASYVHPVHLSRVFQRQYHCTIAEYIRRLRVELSCTALAKSNESLANIALKTGFSDQSHFSKIFKRIMNVTPSEYRTLMRSR
jgi:AraC-like DNA-binding protein